jgi:hypothetical protein
MSIERKDKSTAARVKHFGADVFRAATVDVVARALTALLLLGAAGLGLLVWNGGSVPAWAAVLVVVLVLAVAVGLGVRAGRLARRVGELEELTADYEDLDDAADRYGWAIDRYELYTDHIADVLERLQRVLSNELQGVTIPDYIERGIISPARDVLQGPHEEIRISVLLPDGDRWRMVWSAGHSLDGQRSYNQRIADTLSRVAYEEDEAQYWPDVTKDDRFRPSPQATRPFHSMLSQPIRNGADAVGVLNVISTKIDAFDAAEQRYLTSLASVIGVAVSVHLANTSGET